MFSLIHINSEQKKARTKITAIERPSGNMRKESLESDIVLVHGYSSLRVWGWDSGSHALLPTQIHGTGHQGWRPSAVSLRRVGVEVAAQGLLTFIHLKLINKKLQRKSNGHMVYFRAGLAVGKWILKKYAIIVGCVKSAFFRF